MAASLQIGDVDTFTILVDPLDIKYLLLHYQEKGDKRIVHMLKRRSHINKKKIQLTFPIGEEEDVESILQPL